jgi:hypothetical protein
LDGDKHAAPIARVATKIDIGFVGTVFYGVLDGLSSFGLPAHSGLGALFIFGSDYQKDPQQHGHDDGDEPCADAADDEWDLKVRVSLQPSTNAPCTAGYGEAETHDRPDDRDDHASLFIHLVAPFKMVFNGSLLSMGKTRDWQSALRKLYRKWENSAKSR